MKRKYFTFCTAFLLILFSSENFLFAQQLVFNTSGSSYLVISNGTSATPAYFVIGNPAINAIMNASSSNRWIISEGDYNFLKWNMGATNNTYVYPFGYSTSAYIPFTYNKTSGNANLAASTYYPTTTPNANLPLATGVTNMNPSGPASDAGNMVVDRWWRLRQENGVTNPVADLTFSYRGSENTIAGISCGTDVLAAQYWGTNWTTPVLGGSTCYTGAGVGTVSASGVNVFTTTSNQPFILVKNTAPLPVTFLNFSAWCNNGKVEIEWSTASEQNSSYFIIEQSADGNNFSAIGTKPAAINSSSVTNYSFTDTEPLLGTAFYRVTEVDMNGEKQSTNIVAVSSCSSDNIFIYSSEGSIYVNITASENGKYQFELYNMLGQSLVKELRGVTKGQNTVKLMPELASGIYFVNVKNMNNPELVSGTITKKVFVKKYE